MTLYQSLTLIIPILSATVVGVLTYMFAIRSKKFDLLYQNKIPAFKDIATCLTDYRNFCIGRAAYLQGDEYSPFWEEGYTDTGTLYHRKVIANVVSSNAIFLSKSNRNLLNQLLNHMSMSCNLELSVLSNPEIGIDPGTYLKEADGVLLIIETLYKELNFE